MQRHESSIAISVVVSAACIFLAVVSFCLQAEPPEPPATVGEAITVVAPSLSLTMPARVVSIHDGDTLTVEMKFQAKIRLIDCWAPEIVGEQKKAGLKAKESLAKLADGKSCVVVIPWQEDLGKMTSLGRVLGYVVVNGSDMSYEQVKAGMAGKTKEQEMELFPANN